MAISSEANASVVFWTIAYALLPLWVVAGFVDWLCHRRSRIELHGGLVESSRSEESDGARVEL